MSNNIVAFKKKYVLEDKQTELLKKLIDELIADDHLLTGYMLKPWLASEYWREVFIKSLTAGLHAGMQWLVTDLAESDKVKDPNTYNMYTSLLEWYNTTSDGNYFAFTIYTGDGETIQWIFLYFEGKLALAGMYDERKDIITGILEILNNMGMRSLGFQEDAKV